MNIYMPYAGLGNPDTPADVLATMETMALRLSDLGYTLRSTGDGPAADAFEKNAHEKEVHLPWKMFNKKDSQFCRNSPDAGEMVRPFHSAFDTMKPAVQAIIARNAHVILGKDLRSPVRFVVCWTADGLETAKDRTAKSGYSGIPIALAASLKIPIFNLKNADAMERLARQIDF